MNGNGIIIRSEIEELATIGLLRTEGNVRRLVGNNRRFRLRGLQCELLLVQHGGRGRDSGQYRPRCDRLWTCYSMYSCDRRDVLYSQLCDPWFAELCVFTLIVLLFLPCECLCLFIKLCEFYISLASDKISFLFRFRVSYSFILTSINYSTHFFFYTILIGI